MPMQSPRDEGCLDGLGMQRTINQRVNSKTGLRRPQNARQLQSFMHDKPARRVRLAMRNADAARMAPAMILSPLGHLVPDDRLAWTTPAPSAGSALLPAASLPRRRAGAEVIEDDDGRVSVGKPPRG
ncbi:hypothetical protein SCP_1700150 [Sparassis crispa]|uniref:Uncharacterized protein n=1 Tax=Sparassis crispa TaxID=139825 RepID=A0A401H5L7_9APHY|nr:hypothetical protein SCP_1700150 [Sparassis crispa]GBE89691.1 hypothetical protein SCP_1700150 [Sparassis crispa]